MLTVGCSAQYVPNFLAFSTKTSVSKMASSWSPLYQPSSQISTILMRSSPLSTNCLQLMVERSRTTAEAGADDSIRAAANRVAMRDFIFFLQMIVVKNDKLCGVLRTP